MQPQDQKRETALNSKHTQSYHIANQLIRIWSNQNQFASSELKNIDSVKGLTDSQLLFIASDLAKRSKVSRATILRILKTDWLPEVPTLAAIAVGLNKNLLLECRRTGQGDSTKFTAVLNGSNSPMKAICKWLQRLEDGLPVKQLMASAGISNEAMLAGTTGYRQITFETLFRVTTALGYDLTLRIGR